VTPPFIRDAAKRALDDGRTFYTFVRGVTELREAIAVWASRQSCRTIDVGRVTVPGAAMMGVAIALQCVCEPGDNVLIISPMWPNIFQAVSGLGAEPRFVRLKGGANGAPWTLDLDRLFGAADARTKAIFFASPSNPTGWIMSEREQRAILDFTRKHGIAVISADEPDVLVAARKGSPLLVGVGDGEYFVASDASAILEHTRSVVYLDDGEMAVLTRDGYRVRNLTETHVEKPVNQIDWDLATIERHGGGSARCMIAELF
ncbi:MAG: aminotransferase class I/II-fold pyridoxal phosphate-dependent enzyme, partial [Planctomycetota bacterium]